MWWKVCSYPGKNISVCDDFHAKEPSLGLVHMEDFSASVNVHVLMYAWDLWQVPKQSTQLLSVAPGGLHTLYGGGK